MALTATLYTFDVALSDVDRGIYEQLSVRAACHPSETEEYLLTRVLAFCLEQAEGIAFSKGGISDPDDPPVLVRDLTGAWRAWIEIGVPDAPRLHKAAKASPRVALYTHRDLRTLERAYAGQRIHRAESIEVYQVDQALLSALAARLDRRMTWSVTRSDGQVYVQVGDTTVDGPLTRVPLPQ